MNLNYLSLFSGIGGLDLGLDRAGWRCVGQVERDPYCRRVLARHWPEVPQHDDVITTPQWWATEPRPPVRLVAGGYPCQPFSINGRQLGTADDRWGWPWFRDVVRAVRPDYVLVENVPALVDDADAFGWMLGDLAADGFDAEWTLLSACAMGAPHMRKRLFLVAYPAGGGFEWEGANTPTQKHTRPIEIAGGPWADEPGVDRVAYGVPRGVDRIRTLGNAVVPQVAEQVGRWIREHAEARAVEAS